MHQVESIETPQLLSTSINQYNEWAKFESNENLWNRISLTTPQGRYRQTTETGITN